MIHPSPLLQATGAPEHAALQQLLVPPMQAVLQSAHDAEAAGRDLMLIVLLPPAPGVPSGLDVLVHAHLLRSQPSSEPGTALLLGGPRGIPVGKVGKPVPAVWLACCIAAALS